MEPTSVEPRPKGKGSLENPEVYENVPGHVIPAIAREFDDFDAESERFLDGEIEENEFIGFRLKQGVYGQRQADVQMIRVKLPFGGITPEQMETFADVVEKWVPLRKGHITTRQNIQMHHVPLRDAAQLIRAISDAGLSSREGCGNTVRNVTADPWAGICEDEVFDCTPYAAAYVRYFVRHPTTQLMPRKIKTSFDGTKHDRAISEIHDIAFRAKTKDGRRGFEMLVGGGTSIMPRTAPVLYDFVEADNGEYLEAAEAVLRIFDRQDWLRPNRARARIKVFVDKFGIEELRRQADEERKGEWVAERDFDVERLRLDIDEESIAREAPANVQEAAKPPVTRAGGEHAHQSAGLDAPRSYPVPNGDRSEFDRWAEHNVVAQKQRGFSAVQVRVTRGDLSPEQFRGLAKIMRDYCAGFARTTVSQNLVLRWVRDEALYSVWCELTELGLGAHGADTILDTVSCPGTDSCKLGITSSMGLNRAIQKRVGEMEITDPLTKQIHIKMSGCPNGCGQHHIGNIGFYGASIKLGEKTIPAYVAHVGGRYGGDGVAFGRRLKIRLPAKRVPDAVERWIRFYEAEREDGEAFNAFAERVGLAEFEQRAKDLSLPVEFNLENIDHFIDWQRREPYQVIRGEGECAV